MLKIVIIEDEQPAIDHLLHELKGIDMQIDLIATLRSVEESIEWFNSPEQNPDLIFMDVQLADGDSFNIFKEAKVLAPVIFTTAYDKYLQKSLEHNGIDYLLKPVHRDKLLSALNKFNNLKKHFSSSSPVQLPATNGHGKDRLIVKKGVEFQSLKTEDVAYIYTEHKLIFVVDKEGKKYLAHANNLSELMVQLNRRIFYRANRKYIININFIKKYKSFERVKVEVELAVQSPEFVVISQENSSSFKHWIENL